jgi:hypothetical protein
MALMSVWIQGGRCFSCFWYARVRARLLLGTLVLVPVCLLLPEGEPAVVGTAQVMRRVLRPGGCRCLGEVSLEGLTVICGVVQSP